MAGSSKRPKPPAGTIVTQTNDPDGNRLVVFDRASNGKLTQRQSIATGGAGSTQDVGCGPGCPILDSVGAVEMIAGGRLVFVVNAGSDTITSFIRSRSGKYRRVESVRSGGDLPISLTTRLGLLYVLNTTSGNIMGFRFGPNGQMTAIPNSSKPIAGQGQNQIFPSGGARQISFDRRGSHLVVSELATMPAGGGPPGVISSFRLNRAAGTTGDAVSTPSRTPLPFGFAFTPENHLIMSEVNDPMGATDGSTSSYTYDTATGVPAPVATLTSGGALPCWVNLTRDGETAYVINTGAGRPAGVAKYTVGRDATLSSRGVTEAPRGTFLWTDPTLTRDGKYLYVLSPTGPMNRRTSRIDGYRIAPSGNIRYIGSSRANMPAGVSGLDGR
jgi:6-phosphogluconolactonase (cycloisomerase 2 family)